MSKGMVIPQKTDQKKDDQYAGAYVMNPIVGKHDWVVSFDLNSLYPHLIMQYGISPECVVKQRDLENRIDEIRRELEGRGVH
jgi:DNA polymerase elongation subunit (family B)